MFHNLENVQHLVRCPYCQSKLRSRVSDVDLEKVWADVVDKISLENLELLHDECESGE